MAIARLAVPLLLFVVFCIPQNLHAQAQRRTITIGGAQSLVPLADKFSARFRKDHPDVDVEIRRANSNYAVAAAQAGELQIGLVTRNLSPAEKAALHVQLVGHDAIIFLSYPWNRATSLTLDQLRNIYLGKITNWRQVGGEDKGIVPLTREGSSTLHTMFIDGLFGKNFNGPEKAFVLRANKEKILRTIKRVRGSLGYGIVGVEEAEDEGVKVLAINGKAPSEENIAQGVYPFTRPLLLVGKGALDPLVQEWMRGFAKFAHRAEGDR
jgi:phosphate transport system substrate-binding protein